MRQSHLLAAHNPKLPHTPLLCQLPMAFWRRSTFKQGSLQLNSVFFFFSSTCLNYSRQLSLCWSLRLLHAEKCEAKNHTVEVFTEKSWSMWRKTLKNPLNGTRMWNITQQKGKKNELMRHPHFSCQGDNIWLVSKTQSALTASSTPHPSSQLPVQHPPLSLGTAWPPPSEIRRRNDRESDIAQQQLRTLPWCVVFFSVFQYTLPVWVGGRSSHWRSCG